MADLEKIVKLIFEGDGTGLNRELTKIDSSVHVFATKIQDATGPLGDFGAKVAKAELALIGLGAAGLVYAYGKAKEFESSVIELDKVLGDQDGLGGGLDYAKEKAVEFSDKYGESSKNVLSSIADFKQANFTLAESILLSEEAMRLKIAGDLDAAESSEFLKRILAGFKAEAADSTRIIDSLNGVSNQYNTNVRELALGMGDLSGVAKVVGMTFEQTEGLLTPIISVFGSGSEAANALKTGLIRLVDNTAPVVAAMDSIGVSQRGANGELKNAYDILGEVARAFESTDKSQQLFIAGEIFGKEQAAKMVQVLSDWDQVLAVTETALNSTGSAQEEVNKRLLSAEVAVNRAIVGWENLNIAIGNKFATGATGAVNAFTDIENALRKSLGDETFDVVWNAINDFFDNTKELLSSIAKNLPEALAGVDFNGLISAFKSLGLEVGNILDDIFGGGLDLTTVDGLEKAIQKIINIATAMTNFTAGFVSGLEPLAKTIGAVTGGIEGMDAKGQEMAGKISGWAKSIDTLTGAFDMLRPTLLIIAGSNLVTATIAIAAFAAPVAGIALGIGAAAAAVGLFLKGLDALGLVDMGGLWEDIKAGFDQITSLFSGDDGSLDVKPKVADGWVQIAKAEISAGLETIGDAITLAPVEIFLGDLDKKISAVTADKEMQVIGYFNGEEVLGEIAKIPDEKPIELKPTILEQAKLDLEKEFKIIETNAETLQTAMEWNAKVNIADVEAAAEQAKAAFDSVGQSVDTVASGVADMFSSLMDGMGDLKTSDKWFMMDRLTEQQDEQNKLIESQIRLTEQQIEYMRIKNEKLESGDTSEIKIDSTGLEPALELVMWEIIEKVQIRANENAQEFLLGMPT